MRPTIALYAIAAFWMGSAVLSPVQQNVPGVPDRVVATVDAQQTAEPVSKYEFGMFIEDLRSLRDQKRHRYDR